MTTKKTPIVVDIISGGIFSKKYGNLIIGDYDKNSIPWNSPEDIKFFKAKTLGKICIMGYKTYISIPSRPLPKRLNIVISKKAKELIKPEDPENVIFASSYEEVYDIIVQNELSWKGNPMVIGGNSIYSFFLSKELQDMFSVRDIYITEIRSPDAIAIASKILNPVFFPINLLNQQKYCIREKSYSNDKSLVYLVYSEKGSRHLISYDTIYKNLGNKIIQTGDPRNDRTGTGTLSTFGENITIDVSNYCPILTTKWVAWKTCIKELLWFLKGQTDSKILESQGVKIWNGNTSREFLDSRGLYNYPEGELGPGYGWQIRRSGALFPEKEGGVDQLKYIEDLLSNDPESRRIMWNLWVPNDLTKMALTPCHCQMQLYVSIKTRKLSMSVYIRSNDIFLGNPFNVFSYYVLLRIFCIRHSMTPGNLVINIGDSHIYSNHINQVLEQIQRTPRVSPELLLNPEISNKPWEDINPEDFDLVGYFPEKNISAKMAI